MPNAVIQSAISVAVNKVALGRALGQIDGYSLANPGEIAKGAKFVVKFVAIGVAGIGSAGIAVGAKQVGDFLSTADAIGKMSSRTGIQIEELQKLDFALQQGGSSIETFEKGYPNFC